MMIGMVGPLLETKDRENRRLKRMLSERYAIDGDDQILHAELNLNGSKRVKKIDKKHAAMVEHENSDDNEGILSNSCLAGLENMKNNKDSVISKQNTQTPSY